MNRSIFVVFFILIIASYYAITKTQDNLTSENLHEPIEDLPPAENVLLWTGYRTGSSFFGQLFNQNDDVFYV
jgi:hypothetical protein